MDNTKYFENSYQNIFGSMMATPVGRATFVHLVTPNEKYKPSKYGLHVLFPKNDEATKKGLNAIISMCKTMAEQKFGKDKIPGFTYGPLRDGDEETYQGFAGCWFIKCSSKRQPEIVDTKKTNLDPNLIVPGVLVRPVVTPILFDSGFSYQVHVVQFIKDDGVRYYGGPDPKSLLSALDEPEVSEDVTVAVSADKVLGAEKVSGKKAAVNLL